MDNIGLQAFIALCVFAGIGLLSALGAILYCIVHFVFMYKLSKFVALNGQLAWSSTFPLTHREWAVIIDPLFAKRSALVKGRMRTAIVLSVISIVFACISFELAFFLAIVSIAMSCGALVVLHRLSNSFSDEICVARRVAKAGVVKLEGERLEDQLPGYTQALLDTRPLRVRRQREREQPLPPPPPMPTGHTVLAIDTVPPPPFSLAELPQSDLVADPSYLHTPTEPMPPTMGVASTLSYLHTPLEPGPPVLPAAVEQEESEQADTSAQTPVTAQSPVTAQTPVTAPSQTGIELQPIQSSYDLSI